MKENQKGIFQSFTRGGQLAVHQYRMLKQICVITVLLALCVGIVFGSWMFLSETTSYQRYLSAEYFWAGFKINLHFNPKKRIFQKLRDPEGRIYTVESASILKNPWILSHVEALVLAFKKALTVGLWSSFLSGLITMSFFIRRGYKASRKKLERGGHIVHPDKLKNLIKGARQASDLKLDDLPLIKNKETSHILITGTTGSGKTNCFHTLLPQIQRRPNRGIIVDLTGDFVSKYYRPEKDILLNPFDKRSQSWSPWEECLRESHYDTLAAAIVPSSSHIDKFWENAGKALLSSALKKLAEEKDILKLYHILVRANLTEFSKFFQETDAASYTHPDGEKMTLSIRATLATHVKSFRFLKQNETPFSIRKWIETSQDEEGWLFLSARPDQRETLLPLISGWLDTAINALLSLPPNMLRRFWFVVDELPSLQKLPSLEIGLAESRKYGGCFLAGVQSIPQISTTYGHTQSQAILDLFNTKIFFRNTDPNTTGWISKVLGEAETTEHIENLSYGAHMMRDGVSLAQQTLTKSLVLPSEVSGLRDCEAYLKFPSNLPITKIQMTYKNRPVFSPAFDIVSEAELQAHQEKLPEIYDI